MIFYKHGETTIKCNNIIKMTVGKERKIILMLIELASFVALTERNVSESLPETRNKCWSAGFTIVYMLNFTS